MNEASWREQRDSRSLRYAGRVLDRSKWVLLRADSGYAARYDGQVAILVAANLIGRMTPSLALDIPSCPIVDPLPWAGQDLRAFVFEQLIVSDPYGDFKCRTARETDYVIHFGRSGEQNIVHGSGWNSYAGPRPSPIPDDSTINPTGPAMAAILAGAEAFRSRLTEPARFRLNTLTWRSELATPRDCLISDVIAPNLLWIVGAGSVGTATLYCLSLATRHFSALLFDMDDVKVHNLDRSPIFMNRHIGLKKVHAVEEFMDGIGGDVKAEPVALDESATWKDRPPRVPDVLISAANERNVRSLIESYFPPLQIYGTTGTNWQAAVMRHAPLEDPCSCCLFPPSQHAPTACSKGPSQGADESEQVDAALPFLSFAAGAMAAGEILKKPLPGYPFSPNRVVLNTRAGIDTIHAPLQFRSDCICRQRSNTVHRKMLGIPD